MEENRTPVGRPDFKPGRSLTVSGGFDSHSLPPARLPSVDRLLAAAATAPLIARHGRTATRDALRDALAQARASASIPTQEALAEAASDALARLFAPSLRPVFNLTGTVLHTNLGRAPLPPEAIDAVACVMGGACSLEYDLDAGGRGERDDHVEALLCRLTGAEAATIVNNNAAAVLLVLAALAARRDVLVSRGELVEIGGAFRVPDVMAQAGCRLVEIGTTNRTHLRDYEAAIGPRTAAAMKVHQSNFRIEGFSAAVGDAELGALCRARGIPLLDDLGSGSLVRLAAFGLPDEPVVADAVRHADIVTFSGDKLLGGAQCGLIVGRAELVARVRRHPLKRALRCGKMTLAAMEAVLKLYLDPDRLACRLPALRLLTRRQDDIEAAAGRVHGALADALGPEAVVRVVACASQVGSGALPVETLPSAALSVRPARPESGSGRWLAGLAARLAALPVPVIGRVKDGALLLDCRTLEDEPGFRETLAALAGAPAR